MLIQEYCSITALYTFLQKFQFLKKSMENVGVNGDWDFQISICSKTLMGLIFNPCGEFQ